jgi:hypothetical protein
LKKGNKVLALALMTTTLLGQVAPVYAAEIDNTEEYSVIENKEENNEEIIIEEDETSDIIDEDNNDSLDSDTTSNTDNETSENNNEKIKEEEKQQEDSSKKEKEEVVKKTNIEEVNKDAENVKIENDSIDRQSYEQTLREDNERQDLLDKSIKDNTPIYGYYLGEDSVKALKFKSDRMGLFNKYKRILNQKDNVKDLEVKGSKEEENKNNLFTKYLDGNYDAKEGYESKYKYYKGGLLFPVKTLEVLSLYKENNPRVVLKTIEDETIYAPISATDFKYDKDKKTVTLIDKDQNIKVIITNVESKNYKNIKVGNPIGKATDDNISMYIEKDGSYINPILSIRTEIDKLVDGFTGAPNLYQIDSAWGARPYGNMNISSAACGPSSLSIAISYITGSLVTPEEVVNKFGGANSPHFIRGVGSSFSIFSAAQSDYDVVVKNIGTMSNAVKALNEGKPVITSMTPGYFTRGGHFIALTGINKDGRIYVNDPASQVRGEQTYLPNFIESQMKGAWSVESPYGENKYNEDEPEFEKEITKLSDKVCRPEA